MSGHDWKPGDKFIVRRSYSFVFGVYMVDAVKPEQLWANTSYGRRNVFNKEAAIPFTEELWADLLDFEKRYAQQELANHKALDLIRQEADAAIRRASEAQS